MNLDLLNGNKIKMTRGIEACCPLCNSESVNVLHKYASKDASTSLLGSEDQRFTLLVEEIEQLWQWKNCYYLQCENCSLVFASPFKAGNESVYELIYANTAGYSKWKWEYEEAYQAIQKHIIDDRMHSPSLLEIGAGIGAFVKRISKHLINRVDIVTTELASSGRSEILKSGIECTDSELIDLCIPKNKEKFDFLCLFQVLEHLDNLHDIFNSINYLLKQGGWVIIAVPNSSHREFFERLGYFEDIPPIHITRWNYESFQRLALNYNWKILQHNREPNRLYRNLSKYIRFKYKDNIMVKHINKIENNIIRNSAKILLFTTLTFLNLAKIKSLSDSNNGISQLVIIP